LRAALDVELPLSALFDAPTITEVADVVNRTILGLDGETGDVEEFGF
jgi:hypothetical protein